MFSLETLNFERLLNLIASNAQTPMGKKRLLNLRPHKSKTKLHRDLKLIEEAHALAQENAYWSFFGIDDPSDTIALLKIKNAAIEPKTLHKFAQLLTQALLAKKGIQIKKDIVPTLWDIVKNLPQDLLKVVEKINGKILPSGELNDSASSELGQIRQEINVRRERIRKLLETIMRSKSNAVQDEIVTVRNGRFVIPVKTDFSGKIKGVTHGASSSGVTVFIEPLELIEANNKLQNLKAKEENEISRILFSLSEELRGQLPSIEIAAKAITELDFIKTKVEFSQRFDAIIPIISEDKTLAFIDARHPLLEDSLMNISTPALERNKLESPALESNLSLKEEQSPLKIKTLSETKVPKIVPISFSLTEKNSVMIISGANAGGKTLTLKTAGLLSIMAISGLPIPAKKATVPFYASILADIGDNQSLSANLSTFSSHMANIALMMTNPQLPSLILLDELGTGTDPEEGAALGVAVVDYFRQKGVQVIASTHYRALKIYAANDENVVNASVEFDEKTLKPTYKLLTGIAGASFGLKIARRFGICDEVVEKARNNLDISDQEVENYLRKLKKETKRAEDSCVALEEERKATAEKYSQLDVEFHKKERQRRKQFETKLAETICSFERKSVSLIKEIKDKREREKLEKELAVNKAELKREMFKIRADRLNGKSLSEFESPLSSKGLEYADKLMEINPNESIRAGLTVLLKKLNKIGVVEKLDGNSVDVLVGSMRMRQKATDLQSVIVKETKKKSRMEKLQKMVRKSSIDLEIGGVRTELNLIGKTVLDAESEVDKFLDASYVSNIRKICIIHGFGTGALKNAIHRFLKGHPHVSTFGFAPNNKGGQGTTIVQLKE